MNFNKKDHISKIALLKIRLSEANLHKGFRFLPKNLDLEENYKDLHSDIPCITKHVKPEYLIVNLLIVNFNSPNILEIMPQLAFYGSYVRFR